MYHRVPGKASRAAARRFSNPVQVNNIPAHAMKSTVEFCRSHVILTGWSGTVSVEPLNQCSLPSFISTEVHTDARWAIERCSVEDDGVTVANAIRNGKCIGVSDGSFKDEFGTACWIIQGEDVVSQIKCPLVVPGHSSTLSAYRSELAGIYSMVTMIETLCKFHGISEGSVEIGCDGLLVLTHAMQRWDITNPKMPQFDLLSATRMMLRRCPVQIRSWHTKGHQDDEAGATSDRWALLNIEADDGAKAQWRASAHQSFLQAKICGEPWPLWIKNEKNK